MLLLRVTIKVELRSKNLRSKTNRGVRGDRWVLRERSGSGGA